MCFHERSGSALLAQIATEPPMPSFGHRPGSFRQATEGTTATLLKHDDQLPLMYGSAPGSPQLPSTHPPRPRTSASGALERPAVIPAMHRRLITLPTAGNLKISPLAPQRLQLRRPYPIIQSSSRSAHLDSDDAVSTRAGSVAAGGGSGGGSSGGGGSGGGGADLTPMDVLENDVTIVIDQRQGMVGEENHMGTECALTTTGLSSYDPNVRCDGGGGGGGGGVFHEAAEAAPIAVLGGSSSGSRRYDHGFQTAAASALATATAVATTGNGNSSRGGGGQTTTTCGTEVLMEATPVTALAASTTAQPMLTVTAVTTTTAPTPAPFSCANGITLRRIEPGAVVVQLQAAEGSHAGQPTTATAITTGSPWPTNGPNEAAPIASAAVPLKVVQLLRPRLDPDDASFPSVAPAGNTTATVGATAAAAAVATGTEGAGEGASRSLKGCGWATNGTAMLRCLPLGTLPLPTSCGPLVAQPSSSNICSSSMQEHQQQWLGMAAPLGSGLCGSMLRPTPLRDQSLPDGLPLPLLPQFDELSQLQLQPQAVASKTTGATGDSLFRLPRASGTGLTSAFQPLPVRGGSGGGGCGGNNEALNLASHTNSTIAINTWNPMAFPGTPALAAPLTPANAPNIQLEVTVATRNNAASRHLGLTIDEDGYGRPAAVVATIRGIFDLHRYLAGRDCIQCGSGGGWMSRSQFEKVAGSVTAKWHRSIRVLPNLEPLGEWLERHGLPLTKGPSRRIFKRTIDGDLKTQLHHLLPLLDLGPGPNQQQQPSECRGDDNPAPNNTSAAAMTVTATVAKMGDLATGNATGSATGAHLMSNNGLTTASGLQTLAVAAASLGDTTAPPPTLKPTLGQAPASAAQACNQQPTTDTTGWTGRSLCQPHHPAALLPPIAPLAQLAQRLPAPLSLSQPSGTLQVSLQIFQQKAPLLTAPSASQDAPGLWPIGAPLPAGLNAGPSASSSAAPLGISGHALLSNVPNGDLVAPHAGVGAAPCEAVPGGDDAGGGGGAAGSEAAHSTSYSPQVHMLTGLLAVLHTRAQAQAQGLLTDAVTASGGGDGSGGPGGSTTNSAAAAAAAVADRNHVRQELGRTQAAIHHVQELLKRELTTVSMRGSGGTAAPPPGLPAIHREDAAAAAAATPAVAGTHNATNNGPVRVADTAAAAVVSPLLPLSLQPQPHQQSLPSLLPSPQRPSPSQLQMPPPPPRPPAMYLQPPPPETKTLPARRSGLPPHAPQLLLKRKAAVAAACEAAAAAATGTNSNSKCTTSYGYNVQPQSTRLYGIDDGASVVGAVASTEGGGSRVGVLSGVGDNVRMSSLLAKRPRQEALGGGGGGAGACGVTEVESTGDAAALMGGSGVGGGGSGDIVAVESTLQQSSTPGVIQLQGLSIMTIDEVHRRLNQLRQGTQQLQNQQQQNQQQPNQQLQPNQQNPVGQPEVPTAAAGGGGGGGGGVGGGALGLTINGVLGGSSTALATAGSTTLPAAAPAAGSSTDVPHTSGVVQLQGLAVMTIDEVHRRLQQMRQGPHQQPPQLPVPTVQGRFAGEPTGEETQLVRIPHSSLVLGVGGCSTAACSAAPGVPNPPSGAAPVTMLCVPGFAAISVTEVQRRLQLQQLRQPDAREGGGHHEPAVQDLQAPLESSQQIPLPAAAATAVSGCLAPPVVTGDSLESPDSAAVGPDVVPEGEHEPEASCCSTSASPRTQQPHSVSQHAHPLPLPPAAGSGASSAVAAVQQPFPSL